MKFLAALASRRSEASASRGSELHLQLFQFFWLSHGSDAPLDHLRQGHYPLAITRAAVVEVDIVGEKARHDGGIHRIGHARLTKQIRAFIRREAFAPDHNDPIDVGL